MTDIYDLIIRNRNGERIGLPCFCTANAQVLQAILSSAARTGFPTVIEATCNQVNQDGGYTGMTARDYIAWVTDMAKQAGVPIEQLTFGGDHLGPNPWRHLPIETAMENARVLVKSYVEAGFHKIHIDASMACGGEPNPTFEQIAERAADLCAVAEANAPDPTKLIYIIGTEVPIPGGETEEPDTLDVTSVDRLHHTIESHRTAFDARGLTDAWGRIVSVVTQPGVDFGHTSVYPFVPDRAKPLSDAIGEFDGLTFEAHSTDYQPDAALSDLVRSHFFFLKVGPELTFRFREAIYALARIEETLGVETPSRIMNVLDQRMVENPSHWKDYYSGSIDELERLKIFSYSDRIRYYWNDDEVEKAVGRLLDNLSASTLPNTIVSQFFTGLPFGKIPSNAADLIASHVNLCVSRYFKASGFEGNGTGDL